MGITRPHWSFSAINQYLRCPLQYYFERVLRMPQLRVSSDLVLGSAIHEALAFYHRKVQLTEVTNLRELECLLEAAWRTREARQGLLFKRGQSRDSQLAVGKALLGIYLRHPAPENIVAVERTFLVPLQNQQGEYLETPLMAVIDLLTEVEGSLVVHEFKTASRSYSQGEVDSSLQATCYSQAISEEFGTSPQVDYAILVKTKVPRLQQISTVRTEAERRRLGDLVAVVEHGVTNKVFYPIETPLNCTNCSYRSECRQWQAPKPTTESSIHQLNGNGRCLPN
jgi:putative RecB family exonuclease